MGELVAPRLDTNYFINPIKSYHICQSLSPRHRNKQNPRMHPLFIPFTYARHASLQTRTSLSAARRPRHTMSLHRRHALVTGATRGIGRGIALALAQAGANLHVTGRDHDALTELAERIRSVGVDCCSYQVDHSDDVQVAALFRELDRNLAHRNASLFLLVNNAYAAVPFIAASAAVPFWKKSVPTPDVPDDNACPGAVWELVNGAGLRSNFVCACWALRLMDRAASPAVIVNITSWAGLIHLFDPAYSVGKAAVDRLSAEIANAAPQHVRCFSLCPGFVSTEALLEVALKRQALAVREGRDPRTDQLALWNAESPLFVGRVLVAILAARSPLLQSMNGKVVIAAEAAELLGVNDENGKRSLSARSVRYNMQRSLPFLIDSPIRHLIPRTLYAPWWLVRLYLGMVKFW